MIQELDLRLSDGCTLHVYDSGAAAMGDQLVLFWHHGTPNIGAPPRPLFAAAAQLGIRWLAYDRPGYGGSSPDPGRNIASAASAVASIANALAIERFAVIGHSGGGPHALACAALLPERVLAAVSLAGLAPLGAAGLDWFAGMNAAGAAGLRAASAGRAAKTQHEAVAEFDPAMFTAADYAALAGDWAWLNEVVGPAQAAGPGGLIDDDLAYVAAWGFDPATIVAPLLLLHGLEDRVVPASHSQWLASQCATAELWLHPEDGHLSILKYGAAALAWLRRLADQGQMLG
jgi:pimeloyl-ACP methyl ester carboxylesterase